jgi:hypothetical protein
LESSDSRVDDESYVAADVETVRAAVAKVGPVLGRTKG